MQNGKGAGEQRGAWWFLNRAMGKGRFERCMICLRDEILVLGGFHIFAVVDLAELERGRVLGKHLVAAREGGVRARVVDLPREQARRHGHDGVELAALELALPAREREHRGVAVGVVVGEREARLDVLLSGLGRHGAAALGLGKPARVHARDVARARDVLHDQDVLRLGDHGLEVAGVVPGKGWATVRFRHVCVCGRDPVPRH